MVNGEDEQGASNSPASVIPEPQQPITNAALQQRVGTLQNLFDKVKVLGATLTRLLPITSINRDFDQRVNETVPNELPQAPDLIEMRWRNIIPESTYIEMMKKHGIHPGWSEALKEASTNVLTAAEIITLKKRGELTQEQADAELGRIKMPEELAKKLEKTLEFRPGPQDIVRFAVREVFREDIVQKFGMDDFFPTPQEIQQVVDANPQQRKQFTGMQRLIAQALEVGVQPEHIRQFWRAHWEIPSPTLGREMFHRLHPDYEREHPVDEETFDELLRTQDVMPFWIPRLRKALFALPTRVDIRRMIEEGIMTRREAYVNYRKLGYDHDNSNKLVQLAVAAAGQDERDLTRALIVKGYNLSQTDLQTAVEQLQKIGYTEEDARYILKLEDIKREEKVRDDALDTSQDLYVKGVITEEQYALELDQQGVAGKEKNNRLLEALERKIKKTVIPTKAETKAFYLADLITQEETETLLAENGVSTTYIPKFIKLWDIQKTPEEDDMPTQQELDELATDLQNNRETEEEV